MPRKMYELLYDPDDAFAREGHDSYREFSKRTALVEALGLAYTLAQGLPVSFLAVIVLLWLLLCAVIWIGRAVDVGVTEPGMAGVVGHSALTALAALVALFPLCELTGLW